MSSRVPLRLKCHRPPGLHPAALPRHRDREGPPRRPADRRLRHLTTGRAREAQRTGGVARSRAVALRGCSSVRSSRAVSLANRRHACSTRDAVAAAEAVQTLRSGRRAGAHVELLLRGEWSSLQAPAYLPLPVWTKPSSERDDFVKPLLRGNLSLDAACCGFLVRGLHVIMRKLEIHSRADAVAAAEPCGSPAPDAGQQASLSADVAAWEGASNDARGPHGARCRHTRDS